MKTAAVWGASGFVGRHLVAALLQAGWRVRALVRETGPASAGVEVRMLPFSATSGEMRAVLGNVDVAFHCAGNRAEDATGLAEFARASAQFSQAAAAGGVPTLIQLSTVAVYGAKAGAIVTAATPPAASTPYARSRIAAEAAAKTGTTGSGMRCNLVRIPMVVGPGMTADALRLFFATLRHGIFFHPGPRRATLSCIGISRLSRLLTALANHPPPDAAAVLQFADNVRWLDIARIYGEQAGQPVSRIRIPRALARLGARVLLGRDAGEGLSALANTVTYADDASALGFDLQDTPTTAGDIAEVARQVASRG